jgi:hypothetical protein
MRIKELESRLLRNACGRQKPAPGLDDIRIISRGSPGSGLSINWSFTIESNRAAKYRATDIKPLSLPTVEAEHLRTLSWTWSEVCERADHWWCGTELNPSRNGISRYFRCPDLLQNARRGSPLLSTLPNAFLPGTCLYRGCKSHKTNPRLAFIQHTKRSTVDLTWKSGRDSWDPV